MCTKQGMRCFTNTIFVVMETNPNDNFQMPKYRIYYFQFTINV